MIKIRRIFALGCGCAVLGALVIICGAFFGLQAQGVLFGVGVGTVLGLLRTNPPWARVLGFAIGLIVGVTYYIIQLEIFPVTLLGTTLAVIVTVLIPTVISALTRDRIPLWAMLLGTVTFIGAFAASFAATPWLFVSQTSSTLSTLFLCAAAGFLVSILGELWLEQPLGPSAPDLPEPQAPDDEPSVGLLLLEGDATDQPVSPR